MYGEVIERLMCDFGFSLAALRIRHGQNARALARRIEQVMAADSDGMADFDGDKFVIRSEARPFTRIVASWFDARLDAGKARYSVAV
jgi:oxygen-independent coproporphyrinogen-3 oxidase